MNFNKHYRKLFLEKDTRDQNRHKHGDNLGSQVTNHKMTKFPERSEVCLFSLQEALCFYFNIIGSFIKSLTSFVLDKRVHWFVFFISIRFKWSRCSEHFTDLNFLHSRLAFWVVIVTEPVTSQLFWIVSGSNNFFLVFNWSCWGLKNKLTSTIAK